MVFHDETQLVRCEWGWVGGSSATSGDSLRPISTGMPSATNTTIQSGNWAMVSICLEALWSRVIIPLFIAKQVLRAVWATEVALRLVSFISKNYYLILGDKSNKGDIFGWR